MTDTNNLVPSLAPLAGKPSPPPGVQRAWHVVRTNVNCENRARKGIEALRFEIYMPVEHKWIRHMRKRQRVARPIFARYLFVHFDAAREHWYPIRLTHGVESILTTDRHVPACVPDGWIENFRRAEAAGVFDRTRESAAFEKGAKVKVEDGPFAGLVGEVLRADGKRRVEVLLTFLHRAVPVAVPVGALRAA
jgi:transcriptional antiterminator RfaH